MSRSTVQFRTSQTRSASRRATRRRAASAGAGAAALVVLAGGVASSTAAAPHVASAVAPAAAPLALTAVPLPAVHEDPTLRRPAQAAAAATVLIEHRARVEFRVARAERVAEAQRKAAAERKAAKAKAARDAARRAAAERANRSATRAQSNVNRPGEGVAWIESIRQCIVKRESEGQYDVVDPSGTWFGAYQFGVRTSNEAARRMGRPDLIGVPANRWSRADQDTAFYVIFDNGNGRSHWAGGRWAC